MSDNRNCDIPSVCCALPAVCRALEQQQQRNMAPHSLALSDQGGLQQHHKNLKHASHHNRSKDLSANSLSPPLCEQSSAAALDIVILLVVLGACGFLFTPYFQYVAREAAEILPLTFLIMREVVYQAPIAYASGAIFMFVSVIGAWEIYQYKSRKCDSPHCRGLRRSLELDIQLQTEQCLKSGPPVGEELPWRDCLEIGQDQKELEAELRRMAPPNGRAVLIFRAPCGCPTVRFEAWGSKKGRRSKK